MKSTLLDNAQYPSAPGWFTQAIAVPKTEHSTTAAGCNIHYELWGDPSKPGLLLVHGSGAHAHWWDFIAPFFTNDYHVAAVTLSGMGESGYREAYSDEVFADELIAVCDAVGFGEDTIIVGHSFGGYVTLKAALTHAHRVAGIIMIDSPVRPPDYEWEYDPKRSPIRPKQCYADAETALGRFRLLPEQPCDNDFILDYIARHSLKSIDEGWTWKFDDQLFNKLTLSHPAQDLSNLPCRLAIMYGAESALMEQKVIDYMFDVLDSSVPFICIPEAHHHVLLDQPIAFVTGLRAVLNEWRHSRPTRGSWTLPG